jgi:hypothetical protein
MSTHEENEKCVEYFVVEVPNPWAWEETGIEVSVSERPGMQWD